MALHLSSQNHEGSEFEERVQSLRLDSLRMNWIQAEGHLLQIRLLPCPSRSLINDVSQGYSLDLCTIGKKFRKSSCLRVVLRCSWQHLPLESFCFHFITLHTCSNLRN
eukprot:TRINITY_DN721_c0_g1_i2.p2 TRINITY_DN721_c0_g1~~TRINITY_DN721_c0_g1_i2.p2  ORF type:complete len:108 (-),score=14.43 TRINITY_DN721_c0_g1_i2:273-596(-)